MTISRLLSAVLLVCSLSAFAQQQTESLAGQTKTADESKPGEVTFSKPSLLIPKHQLNPEWLQDPPKYETVQDQNGIQHFSAESQTQAFVGPPGVQFLTGGLCYAIRSYVVAHDEKDSDSTHLVKASTCQPARRFHLKSAESREQSINR